MNRALHNSVAILDLWQIYPLSRRCLCTLTIDPLTNVSFFLCPFLAARIRSTFC
uniref:Uncharacterized protein n=1 Tax=Arundo donax TaxID=35708 RepID=A0A0A9IQT6_ARUDO